MNTDVLNFFAYVFFALAGAGVLLAIIGVSWLAAKGQLFGPAPTPATETPVTRPAHELVGMQPEELPETA